MNSAKLNDWLQVLGLFGVMASLVFVGLQMKQTREIALTETYSTRTALAVESSLGAIASPEVISAIAKLYSGLPGELTAEEYVALEYIMDADLTTYENLHYQYQLGYLPESLWQKSLVQLDCRMTEPVIREISRHFKGRAEFIAILKEKIDRGEQATENCWLYESDPSIKYFNPVVVARAEASGQKEPGTE